MPYPFFVVYSPTYNVDIGPHVFKTDKYRLIMGKLAKVLDLSDDRILTPEPALPDLLLSALDPAYYDDLIHCRQTWRTISAELPINREIIDSVLICAGGSILAACKSPKNRVKTGFDPFWLRYAGLGAKLARTQPQATNPASDLG